MDSFQSALYFGVGCNNRLTQQLPNNNTLNPCHSNPNLVKKKKTTRKKEREKKTKKKTKSKKKKKHNKEK